MYKTKQRFCAILLALSLLLSLGALSASAAETRSSSYLSRYSAALSQGKQSGSVKVTYYVRAKILTTTWIGVNRIVVYRSDGSIYKTVTGTTANGLLKNSGVAVLSGSYTMACEPNTTYYARVTLLAADDSGSDTGVIVTNSVTSPA